MIAAPQHEIKPPDAVIAEDVICQSFIQSSCTLAYACLLIRRGRFELAAHVLHSLEAKQASRFKDMVFYLQAQIGIETGEYPMVKKRLVPRVHQHPNDLVALSLLECCMYREFAAEEAASPRPPEPAQPAFGNAQAASAAAMAAAFVATGLPSGEPSASAPAEVQYQRPVAVPAGSAIAAMPAGPRTQSTPLVGAALSSAPPDLIEISLASLPAVSAASPVSSVASASAARDGSRGHRAGASGDADLGLYQGIANDPNTLAVGLWGARVRAKSFCRAPEIEPLMAILPRELPASLQAACSALESGPIHKVCFSFNHVTASTFHAGAEGMALVTGPLNQSLLAIVRAENTFKKSFAGGSASAGGSAAAAQGNGAGYGSPA
jgi:hypothetical protein